MRAALHLELGFTSAPAENRPARGHPPTKAWFHLRACGEQSHSSHWGCQSSVSPPRLRRTGRPADGQHPDMGFTSAPAENRVGCAVLTGMCRFHLRACGEQHLPCDWPAYSWVSPPRLRRTGVKEAAQAFHVGFTSAPAENRPAATRSPAARWFHLRACGEQVSTARTWASVTVSPPRLRRADQRVGGGAEPVSFTSTPSRRETVGIEVRGGGGH